MKYLTLTIALLLTLAGCKTARVAGIDEAAKGTQRIAQRFDSIEEAAKQAAPESGVAKPLVTFIQKQAVGGKADVLAVDASLADAQAQVNALQAKYDKLANDPWVRAALWIKGIVYALIIGFILVNLFVAGSPLLGGWAVNLGKNVVRLGSVVGPGAFAREGILKLKSKGVVQ